MNYLLHEFIRACAGTCSPRLEFTAFGLCSPFSQHFWGAQKLDENKIPFPIISIFLAAEGMVNPARCFGAPQLRADHLFPCYSPPIDNLRVFLLRL